MFRNQRPTEPAVERLNLRVTASLLARLDAYAARCGISRSNAVVKAIHAMLDREAEERPAA